MGQVHSILPCGVLTNPLWRHDHTTHNGVNTSLSLSPQQHGSRNLRFCPRCPIRLLGNHQHSALAPERHSSGGKYEVEEAPPFSAILRPRAARCGVMNLETGEPGRLHPAGCMRRQGAIVCQDPGPAYWGWCACGCVAKKQTLFRILIPSSTPPTPPNPARAGAGLGGQHGLEAWFGETPGPVVLGLPLTGKIAARFGTPALSRVAEPVWGSGGLAPILVPAWGFLRCEEFEHQKRSFAHTVLRTKLRGGGIGERLAEVVEMILLRWRVCAGRYQPTGRAETGGEEILSMAMVKVS